ncbi:MAG: thioredoxin domain-containing protein [Candidatus Izemoplasmatales bacterium]|nr:thioredoxin domain-containing protein [Candidatus Izemoplasmatales bacterium]MDD4070095.1 thioredoxin domain-containing protein [Candidatus Izemoplasmatales bacterium]
MKVVRITAIWCMSCLVMKRVWDKVFEDYPEFEIIDYDFDDDEDKLKEYNPGKILPVVIFLKDEKEVFRITGEKSRKQMKKLLEEAFDEKR